MDECHCCCGSFALVSNLFYFFLLYCKFYRISKYEKFFHKFFSIGNSNFQYKYKFCEICPLCLLLTSQSFHYVFFLRSHSQHLSYFFQIRNAFRFLILQLVYMPIYQIQNAFLQFFYRFQPRAC